MNLSSAPINGAKPSSRAQNAAFVSLAIMLVRTAGSLREVVFADRFGTSAVMDAYVAAFFIPNAVYLILITGALSPVFVTVFQQWRCDDPEEDNRLFSATVNLSGVLLAAIVTLGSLTARWWLPLMFPGFTVKELQLALRISYIIFPAVVLLGLSGIIAALLNALDHFVFPAISPLIYSLSVIIALLLVRGDRAIYWVAAATAIGLSGQFFLLLPVAAKLGVRYYRNFDWTHPALRQLLRLASPLMAYLLVSSACVIVERDLASKIATGAVSSFNYADRLFSMPASFVVVPLALVFYPRFSREAARAGLGNLAADLRKALRMTVFLFIPITVWMFLFALPLTRIAFERGHFGFRDSSITAAVLTFYSFGLLPNAVTIIVLRGLYAIQDMITPLLIEIMYFFFYLSVAPWLTKHYGFRGLAAAKGASFVLVAILLVLALGRKLALVESRARVARFLLKTGGASILACGSGWVIFFYLRGAFAHDGFLVRGSILGSLLILSVVVYLELCQLFGVKEVESIIGLCSRYAAKPSKPEFGN